jgi:hypothetical protein
MLYKTFGITGFAFFIALLVIPLLVLGAHANEPAEYEYKIGERLATSFSRNCSLLIGKIEAFSEPNVDLRIEEHLWGEKPAGEKVRLKYSAPRLNARLNSESFSPWINVDHEKGNRLFLSSCGADDEQNYRIIVSREALFPAIRDVVASYVRLTQNPANLLETPQRLDESDNFVFAGFIISYLRGNRAGDRDNAAIVLAKMIDSNKLPPIGRAYSRIILRQLLVKSGENALLPESRNSVFKNLVEIGSGDYGDAVEQAIILLRELADKGKMQIESFLDEGKRRNLLINYRKFMLKNPSQKGSEELEKQLNGT